MRPSSRTALVLALGAALAVELGVSAHRRDELLQAARIGIEPNRVELQLDLTPGIEVADAILADIDRDQDGSLSVDEQRDYGRRALAEISMALNGQPLGVERVASTFPDIESIRRGEGTICIQAAASLPHMPDGEHQLSFRNAHKPSASVYLANALVPESDQVEVRAQHRGVDQRDLTIDFVMRRSTWFRRSWVSSTIVVVASLVGFTLLPLRARRRERVTVPPQHDGGHRR